MSPSPAPTLPHPGGPRYQEPATVFDLDGRRMAFQQDFKSLEFTPTNRLFFHSQVNYPVEKKTRASASGASCAFRFCSKAKGKRNSSTFSGQLSIDILIVGVQTSKIAFRWFTAWHWKDTALESSCSSVLSKQGSFLVFSVLTWLIPYHELLLYEGCHIKKKT